MIGSRQGWLVFFGVVGVLIVASLVGFILSRRIRDEPGRSVVHNLNARIKAWWIIVIVVSGALMAGPKAVIVLFAFVSFAALREFITLTPTSRGDHDTLFLNFFAVLPFQYILVWIGWYEVFTIFIPVYAFLILPAMTVVSGDTKNFLARTSQTQWGLMICVYCISHVPALLMLRIPHFDSGLMVIFLILVVQASDVLQYIWGRLLGRRKIAPEISPSKTVEGFVGGILSATALGAGLWWLTPYSMWSGGGHVAAHYVHGISGWPGDVGDQARSRCQGLGPLDRRARRYVGPARFSVLRRADLLPPHALFFRSVIVRGFFPEADAVGDPDAIEKVADNFEVRERAQPQPHFFDPFLMPDRILSHGAGPAMDGMKERRRFHAHDAAQFGSRGVEELGVALVQRLARHEAAHHHLVVGYAVVEFAMHPGARFDMLPLSFRDQEPMAVERMRDVGTPVADG